MTKKFSSGGNCKLKDLNSKSMMSTSSFRRGSNKKNKKDITCKLIRGNVDARISKLKEGSYDAIILSLAGIQSLELDKR